MRDDLQADRDNLLRFSIVVRVVFHFFGVCTIMNCDRKGDGNTSSNGANAMIFCRMLGLVMSKSSAGGKKRDGTGLTKYSK